MDRRGLYDDRAYWKQAKSLKEQGAEVHYIVISYNETAEEQSGVTAEGIHFQIIKARKYISNIVTNYAVKKLLSLPNEFHQMTKSVENIQPDLIQIVDLRILRILPWLQKLRSKPRIIYDIREPRDANLLDIRMKNWKIPDRAKMKYAAYIQQWEYMQAKQCDFLLGVDNGIGRRIRQNLPGKPFETIYNFTDLSNKRKNIPLTERKYDAAYVGGLTELRGAKTMIESLKIAAGQKPEIQFLFVGKPFDKDLEVWIENLVAAHNLQRNFTWIKGVDYQEVSTWYNQIKIGLNVLHYAKAHEDIIQIKLFEYMNYGLPIISSDFGEMQRYVIENEVGICVPPNDPQQLADAIIHLLSNPSLMEKFSQHGMRAVDTRYNWDIMQSKYLGIVEKMLFP